MMNDYETDLLNTVARATRGISWGGSFCQFLNFIGKRDAPISEKDKIKQTLFSDHYSSAYFRSVLYDRGIALWSVRASGDIRVVDLTKMIIRQYFGPAICRVCLIEEDDPRYELIRERDNEGYIIKKSFVHKLCRATLLKLRAQEKAKELL